MLTIEIMKTTVVGEYFDYATVDGAEEHRARVVILESGTRLRGKLIEPSSWRQKEEKVYTFIRDKDVDKPMPDRLFIRRDKFTVVSYPVCGPPTTPREET